MRLTAVHVPRYLRHRTPSRAANAGERAVFPIRHSALYGLSAVQALAGAVLVLSSLSGFQASLGDSQIDSLEALAGVAGLLIAAGIVLRTRWAWAAAMLWVCFVLSLELILYATGDSSVYVLMLLSVAQVILLNLNEVKRGLRVSALREP